MAREFPTDPRNRPENAMFTARECAAIRLRVPASGTPWLDKMILSSLRNEFAEHALNGFISSGKHPPKSDDYIGKTYGYAVADHVFDFADAMLDFAYPV
jgi:hypothetical protein